MKKIYSDHSGSMMICVVALGLILSSLFLATAMQLQSNFSLQQDFGSNLARQKYLQSCAGYLKSLDQTELANIINGNVDYGDVKGSVTQQIEASGFLDINNEVNFNFPAPVVLNISWNQCDLNQTGDLLMENELYLHSGASCEGDQQYADMEIVELSAGNFKLQTVGGPVNYSITRADSEPLPGNEWHLDLALPVSFGKIFELEENFSPVSP